MESRSVLVVKQGEALCHTKKGIDFQYLLKQSFSGHRLLQHSSSLPFRQEGPPPVLIVIWPCSLMQDPVQVIRRVHCKWMHTPILGLFCNQGIGSGDVTSLLKNGLDDYLSCPFGEVDFLPRIQRFFKTKNQGNTGVAIRFKTLVGESRAFLDVLESIPLFASINATLLLLGETGTGKELFARAIHMEGPRREMPFVPVNCGAIPDHLFENEFFGHEKGAFTDAATAENGFLVEAEGGTLFLDEVDALSLSAQVKLLRFLQDQEYRPLGGGATRTANVRIIAATNKNLQWEVKAKRFREDMYYRLNPLSLTLPPLRDRLEDIPVLAEHFLNKFKNRYSLKPHLLSSCAIQKLMAYDWPGNIRELEGTIHRSYVLSSAPIIRPENIDLPFVYVETPSLNISFREAKTQAIEQFERRYLVNLLAENNGNITLSAKNAGKDRRSLQRLLLKYDLRKRIFQSQI
ncbi:MAG: sigma-54 interaction domain-containing protein [Nitrospiria bacterium]